MENRIMEKRTCQSCPSILPKDFEGYKIPHHKYRGQITYRNVCRECYEIYLIVEERKNKKRNK